MISVKFVIKQVQVIRCKIQIGEMQQKNEKENVFIIG